ncbi:hypothetical protein R3P38DRAFT_1523791 [Favolaschia claudopus]|uniref:DUF6533 domain-containing protein n=1 Tax=Favolaschia claudopus TaxID=2862362 RepID=A0AAW0AJ16_9AGAR
MPGPPVRHDASEYSPADAAEYVNETFVDNYMLYATTAMLVYELLTTFDEEVERVWSLKWRLPKLLFMLNRYIVRGLLILQLIAGNYPGTSPRFCQIYGYWQIIPPRLAIIVAQAIMVIRLWAIYNNSRKMLLFLVVVYTAEVVAIVTCSVLAVRYTQGVAQPPPLSCGLEALNPDLRQYASATWIAPVGFELIVVVLTVVKLFPPLPPQFKFLDKINLSVLRSLSIATPARNPTLDLLARDSLIYFAFTFSEFPLFVSPYRN